MGLSLASDRRGTARVSGVHDTGFTAIVTFSNGLRAECQVLDFNSDSLAVTYPENETSSFKRLDVESIEIRFGRRCVGRTSAPRVIAHREIERALVFGLAASTKSNGVREVSRLVPKDCFRPIVIAP